MDQPPPSKAKAKKKPPPKVKACRYGAECVNTSCKFRHPQPPSENVLSSSSKLAGIQQPTLVAPNVEGKVTPKESAPAAAPPPPLPSPPSVAASLPKSDNVTAVASVAVANSKDETETAGSSTAPASSGKKQKPKQCRYGAKCNYAKCKLVHPEHSTVADPPVETAVPDAAPVVEETPPPPPSTAPTTAKQKHPKQEKPCRYGTHCRKPNCAFLHPTTPHEPAETTTSEPVDTPAPALAQMPAVEPHHGNPDMATTDDKSSNALRRKKKTAAAKHKPNQQTFEAPPAVASVEREPSQAPTEPTSSTKMKNKQPKPPRPCRYGLRCHNPQCRFLHPEQKSATLQSSKDGDSVFHHDAQQIPLETMPLAADVERAMLMRQNSSLREMQKAAEDIDDLLKEQEQQRLKDAESLARGFSVVVDVVEPTSTSTHPTPPPRPVPETAPPCSPPQSTTHASLPQDAAVRVTPSPHHRMDLYPKQVQEIRCALGLDHYSESAVRGALVKSDGDVPTAVEFLLSSGNSSGGGTTTTNNNNNNTDEPRSAEQQLLQQMRDMGFHHSQASVLEALTKANGDFNRAAEILLNGPPPPPPPPPLDDDDDEVQEEHSPAARGGPEWEAERARHRAERNALKRERKRRQREAGRQVDGTLASEKEPADVDNNVDDQKKKSPRDESVQRMRSMGSDDDKLVTEALEQQTNGNLNRAVQLNNMRTGDDNDEERERFKAERKAAKKERQRRERLANARPDNEAGASLSVASSHGNIENVDPIDSDSGHHGDDGKDNIDNKINDAEDEAEKKRRWQEELRLQKQRAAEKRELKKQQRRESQAKEQERQAKERAQFWTGLAADMVATVELLVKLCVADFCRKHSIADKSRVTQNPEAHSKLVNVCKQAHNVLYRDSFPFKIVTRGLKQPDLNDRHGTIQHWDPQKKKYSVQLETKKGKVTQVYLLPENLEPSSIGASKRGKNYFEPDPEFTVRVSWTMDGKEQLFVTDVSLSEIEGMKKAENLDGYLNLLMRQREADERLARELEEQEIRMEEEARQRRARQRQKEQQEWEERQRAYQQWKRQEHERKREQRQQARAQDQRGSGGPDQHRSGGHCMCRSCLFQRMFGASGPFGRSGGPGIRVGFGPDGFGFFFTSGVAGSFFDDDSDDEEWDRQWENLHEEEESEKDHDAAKTLGVDVDATEEEIKRMYRRKALKFHPDKYHPDKHDDGMTKEEAEEHFKELNNAYDHMMSKFD